MASWHYLSLVSVGLPLIFFTYSLILRERKGRGGEREGESDLLFPLFRHSLVDS